MGFLKALDNVASGFSAVGSISSGASALLGLGKGVAGLFGGDDTKKQIQMQKDLMSYQNDMNKANSLLDYQRQRQLTLDNASLQKQGLRAAGQNTALGDGSVASAASVGGTSSPTPPSALPSQSSIDAQYTNMINDSSQSLINASLARSQQQLIDEQAENQRIRNITQLKRDIADYTKMKNEAKNISDRNRFKNMLEEAESQYYKMNARNRAWMLEDDTTMRDLQTDMYADMQIAELESKRAYYQNLLDTHDLNKQEKAFYQYKVKHLLSQIELNNANAQDARSHVAVNDSQVGVNQSIKENNESMTDINNLEMIIKQATMDDVIELANRQVQEHGPQSVSEDMWSIFNNWDHATGWQRLRALSEITPSLITDFWSGASHSAGVSFGNKLGPEHNTYNYHTYDNSNGEHSVYTRKKVRNYKPGKH